MIRVFIWLKLLFCSLTPGRERSLLVRSLTAEEARTPRSPETRISLATSAPARTALSSGIKEICPISQQMLWPPVNCIQMLELSAFPVGIYIFQSKTSNICCCLNFLSSVLQFPRAALKFDYSVLICFSGKQVFLCCSLLLYVCFLPLTGLCELLPTTLWSCCDLLLALYRFVSSSCGPDIQPYNLNKVWVDQLITQISVCMRLFLPGRNHLKFRCLLCQHGWKT